MINNFSNSTIKGIQIGNENTMKVYEYGSEIGWKELELFLLERIKDEKLDGESANITLEAYKCVQKKDSNKFKSFLLENKDVFFNNVLSNIASTGIVAFIESFLK